MATAHALLALVDEVRDLRLALCGDENGPASPGVAGRLGEIAGVLEAVRCVADETTTGELVELRRIRDRYMRLLTNERVRHDRDTAAIRRAALDWASHHGDREAARRIEDATRPITGLLWRISQLGARPNQR